MLLSKGGRNASGEIVVESCGGWEDFYRDDGAMRRPGHGLVCSHRDRILRRYTSIRIPVRCLFSHQFASE